MATSKQTNKQATHTLASVGLTLAYPNYTVSILQQIKGMYFSLCRINHTVENHKVRTHSLVWGSLWLTSIIQLQYCNK